MISEWLKWIPAALGTGFLAALGGGLGLKLIDLLYAEYKRRSDRSQAAREVVDKQLDPVLKAADELFGKLLSLAKQDFKSIKDVKAKDSGIVLDPDIMEMCSIFYLFAQFWARIEILRKESVYVNLSRDDRGERLLAFLNCLESSKTQLLRRAWQRAIGEKMILLRDSSYECMSLADMTDKYVANADFRGWFQVLEDVVKAAGHGKMRQKVLQYGVVVQALLDDLDPDHKIVKERPSYYNKLSKRTRGDLRFRVFKVYLKFVRNPEKYLQKS